MTMNKKKKKTLKRLKRVRNVKELITEGKQLSDHIKDLAARLTDIKEKLRSHAESVSKPIIRGHNRAVVVIEDVDSYDLDIRKYKKAVANPKKFLDSVKVPNGKAREVLGDERFERLAVKTTKTFHRVSFKTVDDLE